MKLIMPRQGLMFGTIVLLFLISRPGWAQTSNISTNQRSIKALEQLPGLYKVAGQGALVCDVFLITTPEPVLIDCGSRPGWDQLVTNLATVGYKISDLSWVIATHGHWDHVDNMARIHRENPKAKFAIHAGDAQFVINNDRYFSCAEPLYNGVASEPIQIDRILLDGDTIKVGDHTFRIIHTPGHTPGAITIVTEIAGKKVGFCGDSVTGYYSMSNRSSVIDWETSMKRLMAEGMDLLYAGHRKKPLVGKSEIEAYLKKSLDAATFKRSKFTREEMYQDLVYSLENESKKN
jgi:hydroxyacylglutathione hydrolase